MTYTYQCDRCQRRTERAMPASQYVREIDCPHCIGTAQRIFVAGKLPQVSVLKPFVTKNITGQPVEITSRRQEMDLCRARGLAPATSDDLIIQRRPKDFSLPTTIEQDYQKESALSVTTRTS